MPGVFKQSTGPTSFAVQLEDGRPLRRHHDHLLPWSNVIQEFSANQEVSLTIGSRTARITTGRTLTQPTEPVQSAP